MEGEKSAPGALRRDPTSGVIVGNVYDKYHARNPIVRVLMNGYFHEFDRLLSESASVHSILELGAGEGFLTARVHAKRPEAEVVAVELSADLASQAQKRLRQVHFLAASIYALPFPDSSFDLVLACEVLEHLEDPESALQEVQRVTRGSIVLSVPDEPIWRLLNLMRLRYLSDLGNTPGHVQHWNQRTLRALVGRYFRLKGVTKRLPWIFVWGER